MFTFHNLIKELRYPDSIEISGIVTMLNNVDSAKQLDAYPAFLPYLCANIMVSEAVGALAAIVITLITIGETPANAVSANTPAVIAGNIKSLNA